MYRALLPLIVLACVAAAQTAAPATALPESSQTPRPAPVGTPIVTTTQTPLFRPKVVMRQEIILPKDPYLAGALSLVLPGNGQAYCGKWFRGLGFLVGSVLGYSLSSAVGNDSTTFQPGARAIGSAAFLILGLSLHGWSVLDAVHQADVHNRRWLDTP